MHSSFFAYNLSRPYPFRWFTPVVILGGILSVMLFSALNFASSGYTLAAVYSSDPNATILEADSNRWPSFVESRPQPTCLSINIPVNTQFMTSNGALTYTLTKVSKRNEHSSHTLSSLVYHNNLMSDCVVDHIMIRLEATERVLAPNWGADVQAFVTCQIDTEGQPCTELNLVTEYKYISSIMPELLGFQTFVGRNKTIRASLYWGETLLSAYWLKLCHEFDVPFGPVDNHFATKAAMLFTPNESISDITDPSFFQLQSRFVVPRNDSTNSVIKIDNVTNSKADETTQSYLDAADLLAKSMWSVVVTDLGQQNSSSNILVSSRLLEYFTSNFSDMYKLDSRGSPANKSFSTSLHDGIGPLGVTSTVLEATYSCQIPQRKSTGTLIMAILVADLVFLQVLWVLLKLIVEYYMIWKDRSANICEGCLERGNVVLQRSRKGTTSSTSDNESTLSHISLAPTP